MLAKLVAEIPPGLLYEPKWDGFRAIVERDGDAVEIHSRNGKPMARYFPDLVAAFRARAARALRARRRDRGHRPSGRLDFFALQQRVHPAASRVDRLAGETPASFIAFDLRSTTCAAVPRAARGAGGAGAGAAAVRRRRSRATSSSRATGSSASRAPGWTA